MNKKRYERANIQEPIFMQAQDDFNLIDSFIRVIKRTGYFTYSLHWLSARLVLKQFLLPAIAYPVDIHIGEGFV